MSNELNTSEENFWTNYIVQTLPYKKPLDNCINNKYQALVCGVVS